MCNNVSMCKSLDNEFSHLVKLDNNSKLDVKGKGVVRLILNGVTFDVGEVYYILGLKDNLLSVGQLEEKQLTVTFKEGKCSVHHPKWGQIMEMQMRSTRMFTIIPEMKEIKTCQSSNITLIRYKNNGLEPTYLWHCRIGHVNENHTKELHFGGILEGFDYGSYGTYEFCLLGKMTRSPFTGHNERVSDLLGIIQTNLYGPMNTSARDGYSYFITYTDDYSKCGYVYLMKHKCEFLEKFKEVQNEVGNQLNKIIKILRSR
ncbi:hypothetical protein LIER_39919 [Lithospermum erythrorhizon]|uniref:GAG-pre-integrase domain-containing protein n=1 Tax=Lithospermum erythrorhizon TaxID=34254 RepID=A0AAV3QN56_LITER